MAEGDDDEISEGEDMDNEWSNDDESDDNNNMPYVDYLDESNEDEDSDNDDDGGSSVIEDEVTVEIFVCTFHNGDYDAEFEEALRCDRNTVPLVRATQASYNKPDNWRERNRDGLEKIKETATNVHRLVVTLFQPGFVTQWLWASTYRYRRTHRLA
jgi:hypothetical protein